MQAGLQSCDVGMIAFTGYCVLALLVSCCWRTRLTADASTQTADPEASLPP